MPAPHQWNSGAMFQVYSGVRLGIYEWRLIIMAMESVVPDACCFYDVRLGLYE